MNQSNSGFSRYDAGLLLVSLIWGANYSISKLALAHVSPILFAAGRFALSTSLLWVVVWRLGQARALPRAKIRVLLGWGFVGYTLNQLCYLYGLKLTTATHSALIFGNLPVAVALIGIIAGVERPRPRVWLGIVLGTVGVAMVVGGKGVNFSRGMLIGEGFNVLALILWAVYTVGIRQAALGLNSAQVSAYAHLGGTAGFLLLAAPTAATVSVSTLHPAVWIGILYSSVLSSVVASVLWIRGLKALGGSRTALYNCVTPLVAVGFAWALLDEQPVPLQFAGAALVVVGILTSREPVPAAGPKAAVELG